MLNTLPVVVAKAKSIARQALRHRPFDFGPSGSARLRTSKASAYALLAQLKNIIKVVHG